MRHVLDAIIYDLATGEVCAVRDIALQLDYVQQELYSILDTDQWIVVEHGVMDN